MEKNVNATHHGPSVDDLWVAKDRELWAEFVSITSKDTVVMRITATGIRACEFVRGIDKDGKKICFLIDNVKKKLYQLITRA